MSLFSFEKILKIIEVTLQIIADAINRLYPVDDFSDKEKPNYS